ncbi:hypothetical protein [Cysteiniphilum sp. QT6929]|uniref:hypothetical protein n=1 Tax=Cysteiniphilum sp. QT6929 TaxID=2975055 RepID=UPI0024B325B5|nr:hypothetical protein [Cysteiniphilum sp. QT6929]WHN66435.1 hypothetical protein NYP54_04175 [Cysteiniphilum sp. QT6929]
MKKAYFFSLLATFYLSAVSCSLSLYGGGILTANDLSFGVTENTSIFGYAQINCPEGEGYYLEVKTINGYKFINSLNENIYINYSVKVNGVSIADLTPNQYFLVHTEPADPMGEPTQKNYTATVSFTGLGLNNIPEGGYSDTLYFRISPLN